MKRPKTKHAASMRPLSDDELRAVDGATLLGNFFRWIGDSVDRAAENGTIKGMFEVQYETIEVGVEGCVPDPIDWANS